MKWSRDRVFVIVVLACIILLSVLSIVPKLDSQTWGYVLESIWSFLPWLGLAVVIAVVNHALSVARRGDYGREVYLRWSALIVTVAVVVSFLLFVWPTAYREAHHGSQLLLINRFTGRVHSLYNGRWMPPIGLLPPRPAATVTATVTVTTTATRTVFVPDHDPNAAFDRYQEQLNNSKTPRRGLVEEILEGD